MSSGEFSIFALNPINMSIISGGSYGASVEANISSPLTAFGEVPIAQNTAFIQNTAAYNLVPSNFREYTATGGSTGAANEKWFCTTGTSVGGYGAIQSFRSLNYNAGQGGLARFTGLFTTGVGLNWQGVGLLSVTDEFSFGMNGEDFGVWHRYGGAIEVRTIQVTGASGGSTDLTLTLNGVVYTIPLTSGTEEHNAYEIESWLNTNQGVWSADQIGDTVIVSALSDGPKSGTYSFSHATATGTITQNAAGVTKTSDFVAQSNWNVNNLSTWSTPLDPTNGNVFQIKYQYLGFGDIDYFVEDPQTGGFVNVHKIKWANSSANTSITNPSLRFGMYAASVGTTTSVTTECASCALFVEGVPTKTRNPRAVKNTQTITTSGYTNILALRNRKTYNSKNNQVEIEPININIANESTKNAVIELRGAPTFSGDTNFTNVGNNLVSDVDTTNNTISGGRLLASFAVGGGESVDVNLKDFQIRIPPTLIISIAAELTSGSNSPVTATLTYYEDI